MGGIAAAGAATSVKADAAVLQGVPGPTGLSPFATPSPVGRDGTFKVLLNQTDLKTVTAAFDRLIPADAHGPSASEAGCIEFLDAQLAGEYGAGAALYLRGPLRPDNETQVMGQPQFLESPRRRYEIGLPALESFAKKTHGASFAALTASQIDDILSGLEAGTVDLGSHIDGQAFFELMLQNVREGYLADPIYGGNRNMAGWKMVGFPGARYDYRRYIDRYDEDLKLVPVSLLPTS